MASESEANGSVNDTSDEVVSAETLTYATTIRPNGETLMLACAGVAEGLRANMRYYASDRVGCS